MFNPPEGWRVADANSLPKSVKIMVVGSGSGNFPPSMNLGTEKFSGTMKDYLKKIKEINSAKGLSWKSLGTLKTEAGVASLSQVDNHTEWGDVRMMHVMIKNGDTMYILTGAALKEEFPKFYSEFFKAFKSLRFDATPNVNP